MALIGDIGTRLRLPERLRLWRAAATAWLRRQPLRSSGSGFIMSAGR